MKFKLILIGMICGALSLHADDVISIQKPAAHLIPVSLTGFSGEAQSIIKFDLSVLGIEVSDPPEYTITGRSDSRVEGSLYLAGVSTPIFSRAYNGGSTRAQAHALANDIVKALRGTAPIFQTKVAFLISQGRSTEVCVSDFDGNNPIVLTHDGALMATPSWVPGGHALLYSSWVKGTPQVYEHNLGSGDRHLFSGYPGLNFDAHVSPDGRRVAMILSKSGSPNVFVCDTDGKNLKQLTQTKDEDSGLCWSPDSRSICFVCRSGRAVLQKVSADGGPASNMRTGGIYGNITSPDWSPDGKQIAFTVGSGSFTICVMPTDGGEAQRLVAGEDPRWAPNSRTIIFTRRTPQKRVLCLLDVPTKHVKDIKQISGSCSEPSWAR